MDSSLFVGSQNGTLYALDATSGEEQWTVETKRDTGSPTVLDGTVYFGNQGNNLFAVDTQSGEEEWSYSTADSDLRGILLNSLARDV